MAERAGELEPFESLGDPRAPGPFVFTCEHAGRALPEWRAAPEEEALLADHWGWDVGAGDLCRALVERTASCGVLAQFSRLICDPNRDPAEASFVPLRVEGRRLSFNRGVDGAERERRRAHYFEPYHAAVDRTLHLRRSLPAPVRLCSIHSFTPVYLGRRRSMEVGVLFDRHAGAARHLQRALEEQGFATALNQPYSGHDGLIYAAARHGRAHDLVYLELEVRQDLLGSAAGVRETADRVARALDAYRP